jgi:hypothetical protein
MQAVWQDADVEVHEQARSEACNTQVVQDLLMVNGRELLN